MNGSEPREGAPLEYTSRAVSDAFASGGRFSFVYLGKGMLHQQATVQHVVAYEQRRNHTTDRPGINVLFGDGHVEFVTEPAASRLIGKLRAGENPPTNWR